jgi:putative DNA primase/helicase
VRRAIPPKSGNQRVAWQAITDLARASGNGRPDNAPTSAPANAPVLRLEAALDGIWRRLVCEDKRKTERAQQALMGLQARGLVVIQTGFLWLA